MLVIWKYFVSKSVWPGSVIVSFKLSGSFFFTSSAGLEFTVHGVCTLRTESEAAWGHIV